MSATVVFAESENRPILCGSFAGTDNDVTGLNITGYDNTNRLAASDANTGTLSFTAVSVRVRSPPWRW